MPELAETMRIAVDLASLNDNKIKEVIVHNDMCLEKGFNKNMLIGCDTRWMTTGKNVAKFLCDFESVVLFRLGMTGRFLLKGVMKEVDYKHVILEIKTESNTIYYVDYRKFSRIKFVNNSEFNNMKKYSLGMSYDKERYFESEFETMGITKKPKITEILEEGKLTGIGNYLANEALGRLNINPFKPFDSLEEKKSLYKEVQKIASESFNLGGNTFNGGYIRPNGNTGNFKCKIYGNKEIRCKFRNRSLYTEYKNE